MLKHKSILRGYARCGFVQSVLSNVAGDTDNFAGSSN